METKPDFNSKNAKYKLIRAKDNMKRALKSIAKISALFTLVFTPTLMVANSAFANPIKGMDGSYIGAGVAAGVTSGGHAGDEATFGGNIQGRIPIKNTPVSVRGAVLFSNETSAIMPIVSYDVPIAKNTNVYAGAGYSFVEANGKATPLGNQDAVVLTTGVETQLQKNIIVYSDAKLGINAYQNSPASAVSLQMGVGYRF